MIAHQCRSGSGLFARVAARGGRYRADEGAATAVEFSLILVPFLAILFAIFEAAFMFLNHEALENVTANAARRLLTGEIQGGAPATQKATFVNMICPTSGPRPASALPRNFDCNKVIIDVRKSGDFNANLDTTNALYADPSKAVFQPGGPGDVNVVRVIYPQPVYLSILSGFGASSIQTSRAGQAIVDGVWTRIIMGISVFKVEPY
jgi:Flp pilus assembly protein TadG